MPTSKTQAPNPFTVGLHTLRKNLIPAFALQAFAVTILLFYLWHPPTHAALTAFANWRLDQNLALQFVFIALATAFCGAVLPFAIQRMRPAYRAQARWPYLIVWSVFWAYRGVEVELFYNLQSHFFGDDDNLQTVLIKTTVDMLTYSVFWALPTTVVVYQWTSLELSWPRLKARLTNRWFQNDVLPTLLLNWCVWAPTVMVIYKLPPPLQLPIQNLVLCFWSILMVFLTEPQPVNSNDGPTG